MYVEVNFDVTASQFNRRCRMPLGDVWMISSDPLYLNDEHRTLGRGSGSESGWSDHGMDWNHQLICHQI